MPFDPAAAAAIRSFLEENDVRRPDVAGPRASKDPEIHAGVGRLLARALGLDPDGARRGQLGFTEP